MAAEINGFDINNKIGILGDPKVSDCFGGCDHCERLRAYEDGLFGAGVPKPVEKPIRRECNNVLYSEPPEDLNGSDEVDNCHGFELVSSDEDTPTSAASLMVQRTSIDQVDRDSPILRQLPGRFDDRVVTVSLASGQEYQKDLAQLNERFKRAGLSEEDIDEYFRIKEAANEESKESSVYFTFRNERVNSGLQVYSRYSATLQAMRHLMRNVSNSFLGTRLGIEENDQLLMINTDLVADLSHEEVVVKLSEAIQDREHVTLLVLRDLKGEDNHLYLMLKGTIAIIINRGETDNIEVTVVKPLMRSVGNAVAGLEKIAVKPPAFIWQHTKLNETAQYALSIGGKAKRLLMDVIQADDEKSHWEVHLFEGSVYIFDNGRNRSDVTPHYIWLIRNCKTDEYIAIRSEDGRPREVYLSNAGDLDLSLDETLMKIDERMLVAHFTPSRQAYMFESLHCKDHFLCIGHRNEIDLATYKKHSMENFVFNIIEVDDVMDKLNKWKDPVERRRVPALHATCPVRPLEEGKKAKDPVERRRVPVLHSACPVMLDEEKKAKTDPKCCGATSRAPGKVAGMWQPTNGKPQRKPDVLKRAGMHKFEKSPESQAAREGVLVPGHVSHVKGRFENTRSNRDSCDVPDGLVEHLARAFKS